MNAVSRRFPSRDAAALGLFIGCRSALAGDQALTVLIRAVSTSAAASRRSRCRGAQPVASWRLSTTWDPSPPSRAPVRFGW